MEEASRLLRDSSASPKLREIEIAVNLSSYYLYNGNGPINLAYFDSPHEWAALDDTLKRPELGGVETTTLTLLAVVIGNGRPEKIKVALEQRNFSGAAASYVRKALPGMNALGPSRLRIFIHY